MKRGGLLEEILQGMTKSFLVIKKFKQLWGKDKIFTLKNSIYNFDETALRGVIGPTHVFCPKNQQKATPK